ncbi:Crp/Fnr family transcriptional regulator [Flavobacterium jejuense]|uniref:Crp/Fnr family transcriptional regulator n=1 Tax=Flavobacterium jejuense TaxID=1544455 RepID=A0ABX0IZZ8_9FLAO|nr:Crp/Fnr family transcriptional regulator [Flavobacterium jejuense]NHN27324.1 Crp/Fnr family transcriptional regulator [Flavobacterium jejuense]
MSVVNFSESYIDFFRNILKNDSLENEMNVAIQCFEKFILKKNEFLVVENEVCNYFCFVESGILQHAIIVQEEEKTTYLALKNSVTSSLNSFLHQVPSRKSIKAIADATLYVVTLSVFNDLIKNNQAFHQFYFNLIEKQLCLIDDYRIDLLTLTPEERYKKILVNETKLLQEVPLHYLASFLGISTRHMSRIRKNII